MRLPVGNAIVNDGTMLVWVLILGCWVGLLVLVLHDATKADSRGNVARGSRRSKLAFGGLWANRLKPALRNTNRTAEPASNHADANPPSLPTVSSGSPLHQTENREQRSTSPSKKKWWSKDQRASITLAELESAIAEAVRKTAPGCEDFIGVIVHHDRPKATLDPNWAVRGVKFGKADRKTVNQALATVVEQLQQEFRLTDPQPRNSH